MNRLDIAIREWNSIRSKDYSNRVTSTEIEFWLSERVCFAAAELIQRGDFKRLARRPLDLIQGSKSGPRQLVNQIDAALLQTASSLSSILRRPSVEFAFGLEWRLPDQTPETSAIVEQAIAESVVIFREGQAIEPEQSAENQTIKVDGLAQPVTSEYANLAKALTGIADRPWLDLACEADYFASTGSLNLAVTPTSQDRPRVAIQFGGMLPLLQPSLRYGGDYIFRNLQFRVAHWRDVLSRISNLMLKNVLDSQAADSEDARDIRTAWQPVQPLLEELQAVYRPERESLLTDACLTLVQVYACYKPNVDLQWLGLKLEDRGLCTHMQICIEKGDQRMVDAIADALFEVRRSFGDDEDIESRIQALSQSHSLCIIQGVGRRELYWHGEKVNADWTKIGTSWSLICDLAERAKRGLGLDKLDVKYSLKDAKHRLAQQIPELLKSKIAAIRGSYKLALEPGEICIQVFEENESLTEL